MSYRRLFIFLEGPDDIRFFENVIIPMIKDDYDDIKPINYKSYKNRKKIYVINLIKSIKSIPAHYLFVTDINDSPCITHKKNEQYRIYNSVLDSEKTVVVVQEIESWYYAGLENTKCTELKIPVLRTTDNMQKEDFERLKPKEYTHLTFMREILSCYSTDCAVNKNTSFNYFIRKHIVT